MRSRFSAGSVLVAWMAAASSSLAASPLDEVAATRRVCAEGPAAAAARAEWLRGEAAVTAAGVLPNPSLSVQHQRTLSGPAESETVVGLSVPLGLGGQRFVLQDAARALRDQALSEAHATRFDAALAFREAYVAAAVEEARLAVLARQQAALDALSGTVERLARGGESASYDLLRQRTQARVHGRLLASARARTAASRALLEAWTGEEVTLPPEGLAKIAGGPAGRAATSAQRGATPAPPRIRGLEAAARARGLEAEAARRRWVPDVEVFAGYRALSGAAQETGHGLSLGLTVPLTLFDHGQGDAARADAEQAVAQAAAAGLKRDSAARARAAAARLGILEAGIAEIERAVAEAAALEGQAGRLYAAGEASIAELLDALRAAEEAQLARIDLMEEIALTRLAWMRATGTMLDATLDHACGDAAGGTR
ncbi:TolC family protein [Sorangium sp. So ce260]|uniref:TolC family protein n=1 Tax=Sorangium sp. So ce260 TaxID=3133291 RepID=UPI003F609F93